MINGVIAICPVCPDQRLVHAGSHYGYDTAHCLRCGRGYEIEYQIKTITHVASLDRDIEAEKRADASLAAAYRQQEITELKERLTQLQG